jgi:hypothetical protein
MNRHAFRPSCPAPLEQRATPSALSLARPIVPAASARSHGLNLYGLALGKDTAVGAVHSLQASGATLSPLGTVSLSGFLVIPRIGGATRLAHGMVTLANSQGMVTVSLRGTVTLIKGSFTFATGELSYKIVAGSRADQGATGAGTVSYGPGPVLQPGRFLLDFGNYPPPP